MSGEGRSPDRARRGPRSGHPPGAAGAGVRAVLPRRHGPLGGHRGSGLGLAIARGFIAGQRGLAARRVAARAGGDVRVRAAAGPPARPSERRARPARCWWSTTSCRSCGRCRWCCARRASRSWRRRAAAEALDLAAVRPPRAAIVDLVLPDGDGVEVTRSLREWSEMPILVLSAVGRRGAEGASAGGGRGRLRHQAVRRARAGRAAAGGAAPRERAGGRRAARSRSMVWRSTSRRARCDATASRCT